jgi:hypothetical protein
VFSQPDHHLTAGPELDYTRLYEPETHPPRPVVIKMDAILSTVGLTIIYLALLSVGVLYAMVMLLGGAAHSFHLPGLHLPGVDLHVGGHDIPIHIDTVHADTGAGADFTVDHPKVGLPSLSPITVSSFVTAFGGCGLIALGLLNTTPAWSLAWATGGGLVLAIIAHFAFGYLLLGPQGSSNVQRSDILGAVGQVTTPIPVDSLGEVAFIAQGGRISAPAKSATGAAIARGTTVVIEQFVSGVVVVRPQI